MSLIASYRFPFPQINYAPEGLASGAFSSGVSAQERGVNYYPQDLSAKLEAGPGYRAAPGAPVVGEAFTKDIG